MGYPSCTASSYMADRDERQAGWDRLEECTVCHYGPYGTSRQERNDHARWHDQFLHGVRLPAGVSAGPVVRG